MVTSISRPTSSSSFLSPGQKFHAHDLFASGGSQLVTVARLVQDDLGMTHVVLRDDDNREISAYAAQIEMAIELGNLQPVDFDLNVIAC